MSDDTPDDAMDLRRYANMLLESTAFTLCLGHAAIELDCASLGEPTDTGFRAAKQIGWALRHLAGAGDSSHENIFASMLFAETLKGLADSPLNGKTMVKVADLLCQDDAKEHWEALRDICAAFSNTIISYRERVARDREQERRRNRQPGPFLAGLGLASSSPRGL